MEGSIFTTSKITGKTYSNYNSIRILNMYQNYFYLKNGVPLQDIELSTDRKTGRPLFVFVYNRDDTKEAFDSWCRQKDGT